MKKSIIMKTVMENLQPELLWRHFEALSAIPRASEKETLARSYVLAQATRLGLESAADTVGNIVIRKPARRGREGARAGRPARPPGHGLREKRRHNAQLR